LNYEEASIKTIQNSKEQELVVEDHDVDIEPEGTNLKDAEDAIKRR